MAPSKGNKGKQAKIKKACKAMKTYGIPADKVKSTLKRLLELFENNWLYIEEDDYKLLLDAVLEADDAPAEVMEVERNEMRLVDEPDEDEEEEEEDIMPLKRRVRVRSDASSSSHVGCENGDELLCLEYNNTDSKADKKNNVNEDEGVPPSPCSSEFNIASSTNGEVKLTVSVCNQPPGFRIPRLDAVIKRVEDVYRDKFQGSGTEFSLSQLLKDVCDCFLEQGNASDHVGHKILSCDNFKKPEKQGDSTSYPIEIPKFVVSGEFDHCFSGKKVMKQQMGGSDGLSGSNSLTIISKEQSPVDFFMEQDNASDNDSNKILSVENFKEPEKQGVPTSDPVEIPTFVVSSEVDHCFSVKKLINQKMFGIDELSSSSSLTIFPNEQSDHSSLTLTVFPNEESILDPCSKHYFVADITRGLEKQEISIINEVDNKKLPTFTYIQENVNYKKAHVKFMLARISDENCCPNCLSDCLSPQVPCVCAAETGGEFAYTTQGLVDEKFLKSCIDITLNPKKEDYVYCDDCPLERMKKLKTNQSRRGLCKGHLVRKFIKECWYKCGCNYKCGNRVVQRGIQAKLQVFMTPAGKGWGLRTLKDLPKGTFVCEYAGEIVTNSELFERNEQKKNEEHTYPVLLDADWSSEGYLEDEEALCLDATCFGNVARFINHRCVDANLVEIPVEVESPDHHYYHHAFFTSREVKAMEELTWDYGIDFDDDSHPVKAFSCKCGSKFCRAGKRYKRSRCGQVIARMN